MFGNNDVPNQLVLGNGDGTFQESAEFDTPIAQTYSVACGDVNGDGHADIVFGNYDAPNVMLFGDGTGRSCASEYRRCGAAIALMHADTNNPLA